MDVVVNDVKYIVKKPDYKDLTDAQIHAGRIFNQARQGQCILRDNLEQYLNEQGLWSDNKEAELIAITMKINAIIFELKKGANGKYKTQSKARAAAIEARRLRFEQLVLINQKKKLDGLTAEGQSEQARFDFLVSRCILNENQEPVFQDLNDYLEHANEDWVEKCATELTYFMYPNQSRDWEDKLPENRFLKKHQFINDEGQLVNKDGHLVDEEFRLINEKGEWVDEEGNLVNIKGERIDEDGDLIVEYAEFENDLE